MKRVSLLAALILLACSPAPPDERPALSRPYSEDPALLDPNPVNHPDQSFYVSPEPRQRNPKPTELVYLDPDEFPEAPTELRSSLKALGCTIPQLYFMSMPEDLEPNPPHNLVSGHFKSLNELHWAVICSRQGSSALLLFDSNGALEEELEPARPDEDELFGIDGEGTLGFAWYVDEADREHILYDHETFGGEDEPKLPPIWHEGIECGIAEKGSHILYWHDCQWHRLQGGD